VDTNKIRIFITLIALASLLDLSLAACKPAPTASPTEPALLPTDTAIPEATSPEVEGGAASKVIILDYNIRDDQISLLDMAVVFNEPPNYFTEVGPFIVRALTKNREILLEFVLMDPREFRIDDPKPGEPGMLMGTDVNFTVILPYLDPLRKVEILASDSGEVLIATDLTELLIRFCDTHPEDAECRKILEDG
jgi:hypothetical protein